MKRLIILFVVFFAFLGCGNDSQIRIIRAEKRDAKNKELLRPICDEMIYEKSIAFYDACRTIWNTSHCMDRAMDHCMYDGKMSFKEN